jgi:hypothetical protein
MALFEGDVGPHAERGSLLYIGALYDAYPLTLPEIRRAHGCFVFTEAMPANQYYKNLDEAEILRVLREEGGKFSMVSDFKRNPVDGSYECMLQDEVLLKYFFNLNNLDPNAANCPSQALLNTVKTLWLHAHDPEGPVVERLPSLEMVYASSTTMSETYWKAREKMGTVSEDKLVEYNLMCAIPDVLCWIDDERGFDLRGETGLAERLMVSDAPFSFTDAEEDEEDDDDEGEVGEDEEG